MDELSMSLSNSLAVTIIPNNPAAPHPRFADYKCHNKKSDQEKRRLDLLEIQKRRRDELYNCARGLCAVEENASSLQLRSYDDTTPMDTTSALASRKSKKEMKQGLISKQYKDTLMHSEWLVEVPCNLEEEWYIVPCPEGRRTVVVAKGGVTTAWTKAGKSVATFMSALPGGAKGSPGFTLLDCVWSATKRTYYVLDVIKWNTICLLDCETEFRFFWLKSKFSEQGDLSVRSCGNSYPFLLLPFYPCNAGSVSELMSAFPLFTDNVPALDGLLFYHRRTHYTPGHTPLVGWLKPHMVAAVLGVPVAPQYAVSVAS